MMAMTPPGKEIKVWDPSLPQSTWDPQLIRSPKTFSKPKDLGAGMQGLNSTDVPGPVSPHFPGHICGGACSQAPLPAPCLAMSILGDHGCSLLPGGCKRPEAGLSQALSLSKALSTSLGQGLACTAPAKH